MVMNGGLSIFSEVRAMSAFSNFFTLDSRSFLGHCYIFDLCQINRATKEALAYNRVEYICYFQETSCWGFICFSQVYNSACFLLSGLILNSTRMKLLIISYLTIQGEEWGVACRGETSCSSAEQYAIICDFKSEHAPRSACNSISCCCDSNSFCGLL